MKILERERAVGLRKEGLTYGEIGKLLDVSKAALSLWLRDIPYLPNEASQQRRRLANTNAIIVIASEAKQSLF